MRATGDIRIFTMSGCASLVTFAMMECNGGDDTCFCVSMGSNETEDYALAVRFREDGADVPVEDASFNTYFNDMPKGSYTPAFVKENELKVTLPDLSDKQVRMELKASHVERV